MSESSTTEQPANEAWSDQLFDSAGLAYPGFVTDALIHWAHVDPNRLAITSREGDISYGELDRRTTAIACVLQNMGVRVADRVAFVLNRGPRTVQLIIGILKCGACYVPLDSASPVNRIRDCISDSQPSLVVLEGARLSSEIDNTGSVVTTLDTILQSAQSVPQGIISGFTIDRHPEDDAYIIFTSGSTGRPKGVPVTHAALMNFVVGNQKACICLEPTDVVFQGFSPASDGHHEEIWPTFLVGATLAVAGAKEVYSGEELTAFLKTFRVTVISCAPTLLSMVDEDLPLLRRILFGAENLPAALVDRWWRPNRTILNTYGPTEATVGATFSECLPGEPITIGFPLPNYRCHIIREDLTEVGPGEEGELAISGIGVSRGYFHRDDLSAGKFVPNPFSLFGRTDATLYRTGDRAKYDNRGRIVWLGRIDGQIKIRGHRIELTEIEESLAACGGVKSGVVVVRDTDAGDKMLAALIVVRDEGAFTVSNVLEHLRDTLPAHMVPQSLEQVERIPQLPSGKIDRAACQFLHGTVFRIEREIVPPRTPNELLVMEAWRELFPHHEISATDDFFRELGGYSLLASRFLSNLRTNRLFSRISVLDLYENPSVRSFASVLDAQTHHESRLPDFKPVPPARYAMAKVWQALGLLILFSIQGFFWLGPILAAIYLSAELGHHDVIALLLGVALHAASVPVLLLLTIALKWIVVGKFKQGRFPLWGTAYIRWWFVTRLLATAPVTHITGTPLAALYLRALGAKVGRNVLIESLEMDCPDLIEIGNDCSFENSAWIHASEVAYGELILGRVRVDNGCTVGVRSGLSGGSAMETGASLRDLTCVRSGVTIPAGEEWQGSLARKCDTRVLPLYDATRQPTAARLAVFTAIQAVLVVVLAMFESLPFVAVAFTLYNLSTVATAYLLEPLYAIALVLFAAVQVLIVKWGVMGKLKPGTYRYPGVYWLRKWFSEKHLELCSVNIVPIYDSLFARPWCIALGMRCGPRCEIALPRRMPYDLVEMGEESFLASEVSIGRPVRRNGEITLEHTKVGNRSFLGNDSVVPQGSIVPDDFLLGVLSVFPSADQIGTTSDEAWLGSPPFRMPNRQVVDVFDKTETYHPTKKLYLQRLLHEAARVILPGLCGLIVASILIEGFVWLWVEHSFKIAVAAVPLLYLLGTVIGALICRISKRVFIGQYRSTIQPLWSQFVWKTETHSAVLHDFAAPMFLIYITGTPFISGFMRLMGASVGKRAFINSTDWTETDLISIGDDVAINANAPLQAHLFEDRVMKVGPIKVGDRCSVGNYSVILCESELKSDSHVGHLSLVMKGETIPSNSFWAGSPAQICEDLDIPNATTEPLLRI